MTPHMFIVLTDFQISLSAHPDIAAHVVGALINAGHGVFTAPKISPNKQDIPYAYLKIRRHGFRQHNCLIPTAGLSFRYTEPFRYN